jgi:hypothetical protein
MAPGPCRLRGAARSGGRRRRRRRGSCGAATRVEGRRGIRWRPPVTRVYFIWRRRATRRGWGGGRGSDREARAPRPRASSGDGLRRGKARVLLASGPPIIRARLAAADRASSHECRSALVSGPVANGISVVSSTGHSSFC